MISEASISSQNPVSIQHSLFQGHNGVRELHAIITPTRYGSFEQQLEELESAYLELLNALETDCSSTVIRRFFCSDLPNQASILSNSAIANSGNPTSPCAISWVNQPPALPAKIALWAYHVLDPLQSINAQKHENGISIKRGALTHHWDTGLYSINNDDSYSQSQDILVRYCDLLSERSATLADNTIRTWFFVKDVDTQYQGLVDARNDLFQKEGLTPDTHYIASTGIAGGLHETKARVSMDAYSISGVTPDQIEFLSALDRLSPTQLYGVAFERATSVSYQDRKQIFVSGTASIDWQGQILYEGNVLKQLHRTLENIDALLDQASARMNDNQVFIVYLRDLADQTLVRTELKKCHPNIPAVIVHAPVCRPGWLIEIESIATTSVHKPGLPPF